MNPARVAVVSDTHGLLRPEVLPALEGCHRVLHGGDVGEHAILDELGAIGPVTVVRGNTDRGSFGEALPLTELIEIAGHSIYMIHIVEDLDIDPVAAGVSIVIHGHSHRPRIERINGVLWFNPGSCGPRRFDLPVTVGILVLEPGAEPHAELVHLDV